MRSRSRSLPAVITVYLSLILILVCALVFTLIESARVSSLKARLKSITFMAEDSIFGGFAEPVFDRYGVMSIWCSEEELLEKFRYYVGANLDRSFINNMIYTDIYGGSLKECSLGSVTRLTDDGGQVFADQVLEYMNYYLVEDAAKRILEHISIFDQGGKVDAFMEKIESFGDTFKKVEEAVGRVRDRINKAKSIAKDPARLLSEASDALESFADGDEGAASDFRKSITDLKKTSSKLKGYLEDIQSASDKYYESVEKARQAVEELENILEVDKDEFDPEVYEAVEEQVRDIRQKSADTDFDYYLVGANEDITSEYITKLNSLDELFDETGDGLDEDNADYYAAITNEYQGLFEGFSLDRLSVNFDDSSVEKEDDGFLDVVSDFFKAGILGFVAGEISDKSIDTGDLPSVTSSGGSDPDNSKESLLEASVNKAIYGEYILQHFENAGNGEGKNALEYETEYILGGKSSDKDNLASVVSEIVLIRTGCNLISLLKSTGKKAETYALASSIAGFTGMPIVIKIVQILVMAAWALAESMADAKALIGGHKVRTIKDDEDWFISLAGIKNFGETSINPEGNERGLSYESYLRLLLLAQNRKTQYFRTMDLIQANMCGQENADFRIADCISAVTVNASYSAPHLFTTLPFARDLLGDQEGEYVFSIEQSYAY